LTLQQTTTSLSDSTINCASKMIQGLKQFYHPDTCSTNSASSVGISRCSRNSKK